MIYLFNRFSAPFNFEASNFFRIILACLWGLSFFTVLLSGGWAAEVELVPSLITQKGTYSIPTTLSYTMENSGCLVPAKAFVGPVICFKPLSNSFYAGLAPRFQFEVKGSSENLTDLKNLFFAAAPDGALYLADPASFQNEEETLFSSYPLAKLDRPYSAEELENWYWYPFMMEALRLALEARSRGDHPFGALIVNQGKILVRASNTVNTDQRQTAHAELNLESLAGSLPGSVRAGSVLVTSTEPCAMCAAGAVWTGVHSIVYGLSAPGLAAITGGGTFVVPSRELLGNYFKKRFQVRGPIFEGIASMVHQGFWKRKD